MYVPHIHGCGLGLFLRLYGRPPELQEPIMSQQQNLAAQAIELDFGGEVPYAFDYLPENNRLNREMFARAAERARRKKEEKRIP